MKGFRKLSSIAILLFAFVYPPSLAEAKDISLSNSLNEQSVGSEVNLVEGTNGEFLIAQRRFQRGRYRQERYRQERYRRNRYRQEQYRRNRYRQDRYRREQYRRERYRGRQFR
ncbi:hypothetical protein JYQ62_31320 [Nostoc sp. UHCC 0702]|nr:hypothetical protein JYQ62_31320 [Nostoc sp. UHCC 0702]